MSDGAGIGLGKYSAQKISSLKDAEPKHRVQRLKWQKPDYTIKYGKNIALVGEPMVGKTILGLLFGYFNREYINDIRDAGYDKVVELLKADILPEIRKIVVLEPENKLIAAMNDGVEKLLLKPFKDNDTIDIIPIPITRKEQKFKNDKVITARREHIEEMKDQFDMEVGYIVDEVDEHTLFMIDSMTDYKKLLDDRFGLLFEVINKKNIASLEGVDTYRQAHYASRNTWWENLMKRKRGFRGWNIDTYKESETPERFLKAGEDPVKTKWVGGTEHNLDMVYRIIKITDTNRRIKILNGRYLPAEPEQHEFAYPLLSKMGAMPLIEAMAEKLLLGETAE